MNAVKSLLIMFVGSFLGLSALFAQDCANAGVIAVSTSIWAEEISWILVDETGETIASGDGYTNYGYTTLEVCLGSGCHTLTLLDSFGDGWNGADWSLVDNAGATYGPYTLTSGSAALIDIAVEGDCSTDANAGCTDELALNYNPSASEDDGSCVYSADCVDCEDAPLIPVCALDLNTGNVTTFPSECIALCLGAIPLNSWDCDFTGGCTDPEAENYDPWAAYDDGSCIEPCEDGGISATFYLCTFSNGAEVALDIVSENGDTLFSQIGFNNVAIVYEDFCLAGGCFTATLYNAAGNTGWYNGYFSLSGSGVNIYNVSLPDDATSATFEFSVDGSCESVSGCTDPEAPNYDASATWDDGSCLPTCDCDSEPYDPVCVWDWTNNGYTTLNNACEAACLGWPISWFGDCSETPVYGCMDEEALNYNAEANMDQGCVYAPNCAEGQIEVSIEITANTLLEDWPAYFYVVDPEFGTAANVVSFSEAGITYGLGCLEPGCYNFFVYETWSGSGLTAVTNAGGVETTFTIEAGAYSGGFGWAVGVDEACVYEIPGCTDPEALNYYPSATVDDGSCTYPLACDDGIIATLYVCTFSNGSSVGLNITASDGTVVYDQQGYSNMAIMYEEICIDPEACYTVTMTNNSGGYGWYGGYYWIDLYGIQVDTGSLSDWATEETGTFGWLGACEDEPGISGCTDPAASNYDAEATVDDGSCIYPSPCPIGQEVNFLVFAPTGAWVAVTDDEDNVIAEDEFTGGTWAGAACMADGCYHFHLETMDGSSVAGTFASMSMEDGTALSMIGDAGTSMDEDFAVGTGCSEIDFDGFGGSPWEFDETIAFTPYPNPTETLVNIGGSGWDQHFPIDVYVRDIAGKVVFQQVLPGAAQPRIDVAKWPAGMYLIQILQGDAIGTAPFMKLN